MFSGTPCSCECTYTIPKKLMLEIIYLFQETRFFDNAQHKSILKKFRSKFSKGRREGEKTKEEKGEKNVGANS